MTRGVTARAKGMWDEGGRWDEILVCLRGEGFSKVVCIRATVEILRLPLAAAKRLVHESRAWADRREPDDRFHEVIEVEFRAEASAPDGTPRRDGWNRGATTSRSDRS